MISNQQNITICLNNHKIHTRPNASHGTWLMFLLPLALIISASTHPVISTATYKLSAILSVGLIFSSLIFLYEASHLKRLKFGKVRLLLACGVTTILFQICLHRGAVFSCLSAITSTFLYLKVYLMVLQKLPHCFTLGEAAICSQSYVSLLYFTALNIHNNVMIPATSAMQISTLIIQVGLIGLSAIIFSSYKLSIRNPFLFYPLVGLIFLVMVLLPIQILLKKNALFFILSVFWTDLQNNKVILYWVLYTVVTVVVVNWRIKKAQKATTSVRKIFHILTIVVFIPGLLYNCSLLYLASGVVLGIFFMLEILRVLDMPPLGEALQNGIVVFGDEKDTGIIAFTPMYLLAGCSLPIWVHPSPCDVTNSAIFDLLPLLSGILTIGVGDTAASIVGSKFGRLHWKRSKKTIEGTAAFIFSQVLLIFVFVYFDYIKLFTPMDYGKVATAVLTTAIVEAKTDQVDNLVLPFIMYIILII